MNNKANRIKLNRKWLSVLLTICMVISLIPATVMADKGKASVNAAAKALSNSETDVVAPEVDTSNLDDILSNDKTASNTKTRGAAGYTTLEEAGAALREIMKNRQTPCTVTYIFPEGSTIDNDSLQAASDAILAECFAITDVPNEGDYIKKQYNVEIDSETGNPKHIKISGYGNTITFNYPFYYYTTAEQEAAVATKIDQVLSSLNLNGKSDYDKFIAIYDYICRNVTYDYDNLNDDSYKLKYTAYAALCQGTAVCQGYANLLYRMLKQVGIETRLISGIGNGGPHAWNIVKIGNVFYNVDSTWDSNEFLYRFKDGYQDTCYLMKWRLLSDASFTNHTRDDDFLTSEFYAKYPMSSVDYPHPSFLGHTLSLYDTIGVKFMVYIPEAVTKEDVYVDFVVEDGRREQVTFDQAEATPASYGDNFYWYTCEISAMEFADSITATLHYGNDRITDQYSAQQYCQYIRDHGGYDQKVLDIVNALQNYGYYMQLQSKTADGWKDKRSHHADITKYSDFSDSYIATVKSNVASYAFQKPTNNAFDRSAYSLTMNEKITLNVYCTLKYGSLNMDTIEKDNVTWYTRSVSGLPPYYYGQWFPMVNLGDGSGGNVCVLSYVNSVLTNNGNRFSHEKQLAMVALYDYYAAACRYVGWEP